MTQPMKNKLFYLASQSPRRQELLSQLQINFDVVDVDVEESRKVSESALDYVKRIAILKAQAGLNTLTGDDLTVIGGDTSIVLDEDTIGKPLNEEDAVATLKKLSGKSHQVYSSVAVVTLEQTLVDVSITCVTFKELSDKEIMEYVASQEPFGKAGSYAIQGLGAKFVANINGSYSGVMGLPLFELNRLLEQIEDKKQ